MQQCLWFQVVVMSTCILLGTVWALFQNSHATVFVISSCSDVNAYFIGHCLDTVSKLACNSVYDFKLWWCQRVFYWALFGHCFKTRMQQCLWFQVVVMSTRILLGTVWTLFQNSHATVFMISSCSDVNAYFIGNCLDTVSKLACNSIYDFKL